MDKLSNHWGYDEEILNNRYSLLCKHEPPNITDKNIPLKTFVHYSDPTSKKEQTVFGKARKGLFYNYDDRIWQQNYTKWHDGLKLAATKAPEKSAKFYEIALAYFHDVEEVNLEHVILGCNQSNGYSYLVFGYTYEKKENKNG